MLIQDKPWIQLLLLFLIHSRYTRSTPYYTPITHQLLPRYNELHFSYTIATPMLSPHYTTFTSHLHPAKPCYTPSTHTYSKLISLTPAKLKLSPLLHIFYIPSKPLLQNFYTQSKPLVASATDDKPHLNY